MDILVLSVYTYTSTYAQTYINQLLTTIFKANKKINLSFSFLI